ncbi:hypothetical protein V2J09_002043 [Rumex salicifolius]
MEDPSSDHTADSDQENSECTIKEVEVTVPTTDDPSLPVMTFRMWVLGVTSCVLLSFVNQFMWYRKTPMMVSSICAQIAVVPIGHLMAKTVTGRVFFKGTPLEFTLNPGPFNIKEHVMITIFANAGAGSVYGSHILSAVKLLYKRRLTFIPAAIIMFTTQTLGYGWAGLLRRFLVEPPEMWWPGNLVQVSLFRALHEREKRPKGSISRTQFFVFVVICTAAYTIIPSFLLMSIITISWICWIKPKSVLANQLGSGQSGLGILSFGIDWATVTSYLGTPLVSPWFATANILVGFTLFMYVIIPIFYWTNTYNAKTFPIYSNEVYMSNGSVYDTNTIINSKFEFDKEAYARNGPINLINLCTRITQTLTIANLACTQIQPVEEFASPFLNTQGILDPDVKLGTIDITLKTIRIRFRQDSNVITCIKELVIILLTTGIHC